MSKTLTEIRETIDRIDNQVHDLLMERAELVSSVAMAKKKEGLQIVQPAREARMIRRLLSRHNGPLPKQTVVRIWRELVGSVSLLQTGLSVVVVGQEGQSLWDMAKNYFGSVVPMKKITGAPAAVSAIRNNEFSFAVMPWPELQDFSPWWIHLMDQQSDEKLSVICALPYGSEKGQDFVDHARGLVISKIEFMPSDDDNSFIALEVEGNVSRAKIMEQAEQAGLPVINLYTAPSTKGEGYSLNLIEVQGYFTQDAEEIARLHGVYEKKCLYCGVIGGYPVVPDIERLITG